MLYAEEYRHAGEVVFGSGDGVVSAWLKCIPCELRAAQWTVSAGHQVSVEEPSVR